jgi:asparagine synthase (glutamine-hydrolysing)
VVRRKKVGLEMPYSEWLCGPLRDVAEECLGESRMRDIGLFDGRVVARYWSDHLQRRADHGRLLWGLVNWVVWHGLYIGSQDYRRHLVPPRAPRPTSRPSGSSPAGA